MEGGAVEVYVGPDKKMYTIPRALLSHHSEYFQRSLNGQFREASENQIHLTEDDPKTFILVLEWLYKGTLNILDDRCHGAEDRLVALRAICHTLCELYCLADKLLIHPIQDYAFTQLERALRFAGNDFPMTQETIMDVYKNTHEDSALRKWVLEKLALNLVSPLGHHCTAYVKVIEGPQPIPGFGMLLIAKMRNVRSYDFWVRQLSE